ncbi:MAG TPA: TIGR03086 family metal-binding protein [Acidimicrobiales bacterium]|nr:TIGR03086 family metal-binding protein [Acidimicrobiales bacterium]
MEDLLGLYQRANDWTGKNVKSAAKKLDAGTPCDKWDVRTLLNHVIDTQQYFSSTARGQDASPPASDPPELLGDDPVAAFDAATRDTYEAFSAPGVIEKTGPSLGVAFSDLLLHGWDLARAAGEDDTMPEGLPEAAYELIHGKFTDEQRKGLFKPEVSVGADASAQERLLAYTGRNPS